MIRTIFFDFGNVIAFFDHARAIRQLLPYTDRTADQLRQLIYYNDLDIRYERGEVTTEEVFAVAQEVAGLRCTFDQFVTAFCDIFWSNPPMDDLIPRLKRAGFRLVLASNTNAAHYERYREQFRDTLSHFDAIVVSRTKRERVNLMHNSLNTRTLGRAGQGRVPICGRFAGERSCRTRVRLAQFSTRSSMNWCLSWRVSTYERLDSGDSPAKQLGCLTFSMKFV